MRELAKIAPTCTYKEYEQNQYKLSYIIASSGSQQNSYFSDAETATTAYKGLIYLLDSKFITNLKLECVSVKSKVKFSDIRDVNSVK